MIIITRIYEKNKNFNPSNDKIFRNEKDAKIYIEEMKKQNKKVAVI